MTITPPFPSHNRNRAVRFRGLDNGGKTAQ